jgi:hypothetical protein
VLEEGVGLRPRAGRRLEAARWNSSIAASHPTLAARATKLGREDDPVARTGREQQLDVLGTT